MRFLELPQDKQVGLMQAFHRWVYPLYFTTGVDGFDYQFVGTSFVYQFGDRKFFVFTEHQYNIAEGCDKWIFLPDRPKGGLVIPEEGIFRFPDQDLAICEVHGHEWLECIAAAPTQITKGFKSRQQDFLYAITGYRQVHNRIDYEGNLIAPDLGSIVTAQVDKDANSLKIDISTNYAIIGRKETSDEEGSIEARTQGLSGSPVFGFKVGDDIPGTGRSEIELEFLGVVTHVHESTGVVHATHTMDFLSCLDAAFGIFDEMRGLEESGSL